MLKLVTVPSGVFMALWIVIFFMLGQYTNSTSVLDQVVIDRVTQADVDTPTFGSDSDQGEIIGAADEAGSATSIQAQYSIYLEEIRSGLIRWLTWVMGAGAVSAILWLSWAMLRQRSVYGPRGQSAARPMWFGLFLSYVAIMTMAFGFFIHPLEISTRMDQSYPIIVVLLALVGLLGFVLATSLGSSRVMRPSVPVPSVR